MSFKVHHAVAAKAKRLGITFAEDFGDIVALKDGEQIGTGNNATEALAKAEATLKSREPKPTRAPRRNRDEDEDEDEDFEGDEDEDEDEAWDEEDDEAIEDEADAGDDGIDPEDDEEAEGEEGGKSIVKKKYKQQYRPFHHRNGDDLSKLISDHVAERGEDGEIVKPQRVDPDRLRRFANANGVWNPAYNNLNIGQRRMNIGNRIRSKAKKGEEIVWA